MKVSKFSKFYQAVIDEWAKRRSNWERPDLFMLTCVFSIGVLFVCRTSGFLFLTDDLRYLWWCYERSMAPWMAFLDPPLFANYYRPVNELIWWLHYMFFGVDPFLHQIASGVWWLFIPVLLYMWNRRAAAPIAGFFACLLFFSFTASWQLILWKSWLSSTGSIVFQLAALSALQCYSTNPQRKSVILFVVFFLCACLCKESARFCLPLTAGVYILFSPSLTIRSKIKALTGVALFGGLFFFSSSSLTSYAFHSWSYANLKQFTVDAAYYSQYIWGNSITNAICITFTSLSFFADGRNRIIPFLFTLTAAFAGLIWSHSIAIPLDQSVSLASTIFVHGLWFTGLRGGYAAPLIWLGASFWPLSLLSIRNPAYATDAAVAASLLLGMVIYESVRALLQWKPISCFQWKIQWTRLIPGLLSIVFALSIYASARLCFLQVEYNQVLYDDPIRVLLPRVIYELCGIRSWGRLYIDVGEQLGAETYLALILSHHFPVGLVTEPPSGSKERRLEAYTLQHYRYLPSETPLNIWLPENAPAPSQACMKDPYFQPEQWKIHAVFDCDTTTGWIPETEYTHQRVPYGQGVGFVTRPLHWNSEPQVFHFEGPIDPTSNPASPLTLTFWLHCQRAEMIETMDVEIHAFGKKIQWSAIEPEVVNTNFHWRRIVLHESNAFLQEKSSNDPARFTFILRVQTRDVVDVIEGFISIDEIRISSRLKNEG